jgi:hypothetical protein
MHCGGVPMRPILINELDYVLRLYLFVEENLVDVGFTGFDDESHGEGAYVEIQIK